MQPRRVRQRLNDILEVADLGARASSLAFARPARRANTTGRAVEATSLSTLIHMVDSGLGVTLLPAMGVRAGALRGTRIDTRPLAGPDASRSVGLAWRASSAQAESYKLLADVIREAAGGTYARRARRAARG